jgi:hypothetical protein
VFWSSSWMCVNWKLSVAEVSKMPDQLFLVWKASMEGDEGLKRIEEIPSFLKWLGGVWYNRANKTE